MEIITNLDYNEDQHTLEPFMKTYFKPALFPMVSHKVVGTIMNGRNMVQAMEQLLRMDWRTMRLVKPVSTGQRTLVDLEDGNTVSVQLLQSPTKDKTVMMVVGDKEKILHMVIAYVGTPETFHKYLEELGVSKYECYDNIIHLEEDDDE